jgi:cyclophilin family peptidyl-prolyl cis-trans isomerase
MSSRADRWIWGRTRVGTLGLVIGLVLGGCSRPQEPAPTEGEQPPAATEAKASPGAAPSAASLDPRLHQSFKEATTDDPPGEWQRPPDLTMTHKSVGKLYEQVVRLWDAIRFETPNGKKIAYRAILDTEEGTIEITLRPDLAPNHVRSFVALAKVGYYDGLVFERTIEEAVEGQPDAKVEVIEAGCPMGTGEPGFGSIGYWLKPEFNPQATHDDGMVGASHGEEADTAACKFYINLCKAPFMDGNYTIFGKVTQGLNVAHKILSLPRRNDPEYPEGDRPVNPVVIRKVTIQTEEVDNWK